MTTLRTITRTAFLLAAVVLVAGAASGAERPVPRVAVVVDATVPRDPALIRRAEAAVERAREAGLHAELRVPRSPTEQLSVTRTLATRGFDLVVGAGLDRAIAVDPVRRRHSGTRFVLVTPRAAAIERALPRA